MKCLLILFVTFALVASLVMAPVQAAVILEDNFNTGDMIGTPDTGIPWQLGGSGTVPLVDGWAIFDPTVNNPIDQGFDPTLPGGQTVAIKQRFIGPNLLSIPAASSGMMLELNGAVMDRGADATPNDENATSEDIDSGEFRLSSAGTELYVPSFGSPFGKFHFGTYFTGYYVGSGDPRNNAPDSGVPLPGPGETHHLRSRIRSLPTGHGVEAIMDVSADGGASYSRIGRTIAEYEFFAGDDAENPGVLTAFDVLGRGVNAPLDFPDLDEGEFALDFIRLEDVPFAPDKGDMDIDGDVDFDDIDDFVLGLNDPNTYRSTYWVESSQNGNIDMDGDQDFDDIAGFVGLLSGGGGVAGVPEPTTMLLAVLGALGVGCYRWRKLRG